MRIMRIPASTALSRSSAVSRLGPTVQSILVFGRCFKHLLGLRPTRSSRKLRGSMMLFMAVIGRVIFRRAEDSSRKTRSCASLGRPSSPPSFIPDPPSLASDPKCRADSSRGRIIDTAVCVHLDLISALATLGGEDGDTLRG
jgi:hypothetical protein